MLSPDFARSAFIRLIQVVGLVLLVGCASSCRPAETFQDPADPGEAEIRGAIETYLREVRGIDPDVMQIELVEFQVDGSRAHAVARFSSAQAPDGLEFEYELTRIEGGWEVSTSSPRGGHGGGTMPEGHPSPQPAEEPSPTAS